MKRRIEVSLWFAMLSWLVLTAWPASFWYDPGTLFIEDRGSDDPFHLVYTGQVRRGFIGSYSVVMRSASDNGVVAEDRSNAFPYRVGAKRPDPITIQWWAPGDYGRMMDAGPGLYYLETCWTIHRPFFIALNKTICVESNIFEVTA